MLGILPAPGVLIPPTIEYELEERATIARLLFQPFDDLDKDQVYRVRVQLIETLMQLGKRQAASDTSLVQSVKVKKAVATGKEVTRAV